MSPLQSKDRAMACLSLAYRDLAQFQADEEGAPECPKCGMQAAELRRHRMHLCPVTKCHWRAAIGAVATLVHKQLRSHVWLMRPWQGIVIVQQGAQPRVYFG